MNIFLDTETTGVESGVHNLLTISAIATTDANVVINTLDIKVRPPKNKNLVVGFTALGVNNIDLKTHLAEAMNYESGKEELLKFLKASQPSNGIEKPVLVGHNIQFDLRFLDDALGRHYREFIHKYTEDTAVIGNFLGYRFKNLADLAYKLKIEVKKELLHTSMYDAELTRLVYFKLKDMVYGDING